MTPVNRDTVNRVALADVAEKDSPRFTGFMDRINAFAAARGLRQMTTWSKVWEYPWLWFNALASIDWRGKHVIDLGSELSPMPWYLATLGARVTLIETDRRWSHLWKLLAPGLNVDWRIIADERIPAETASADVVTSFSVIEHQPDKAAAVAEVLRVLKPGGLFAVSFDICQPDMNMTFPEWNGRALTIPEFDRTVWAAFAPGVPAWNLESIPAFLDWHRTTAPHHNYVVGAAVLRKPGGAEDADESDSGDSDAAGLDDPSDDSTEAFDGLCA